MTNKEKYYTFCDIEKTIPIFSQAWWLDAVCGDDWDVCLVEKGNEIYAQATGQGQFQLFAENETTFFAKVAALKVVFNKNASGKVESFTLHQGGQESIAKKIE